MDVLHFTNIDIHLRKNEVLEESFINKFYEIVRLLKAGHPIQYILGMTEFDGLVFRLNRHTLIPRPETTELVHWVASSLQSGQSVLDIGTGSGCIAVSLAYRCPGIKVSALDISPEAIQIAHHNASLHPVNIDFILGDILQYENYSWGEYDVIVSNPPYIRESEQTGMEARVLEHEPHLALFVPDHDPLLFYRKIAEFGKKHLKKEGCLYFEINEALGKETIALLESYAYRNIELKKDFAGKDRMIRAVTSGTHTPSLCAT